VAAAIIAPTVQSSSIGVAVTHSRVTPKFTHLIY